LQGLTGIDAPLLWGEEFGHAAHHFVSHMLQIVSGGLPFRWWRKGEGWSDAHPDTVTMEAEEGSKGTVMSACDAYGQYGSSCPQGD
jgi:hypothetical protein